MRVRTWGIVGGMILATAALAAGLRADTSGPAAEKKKAVAAVKDDGETKTQPRARWLRVEVVEGAKEGTGGHEPTVSIRAPLALLRLLGKDATIDLAQMGAHVIEGAPRKIAVADLLDTLEPGIPIVEVKDANSHVKIWVE